MALERASGGAIDIAAIEGPIEAAILALFRGLAESDGFNRLVLEAGLGWRDVAMVRALGRYLRQIGVPYGQNYLALTLARHPAIAPEIVALFYARFDPRAETGRARGRGRAARRHRGSPQGGHEPRRRPHPAPLRQPRAGGGSHQLLPARRQRPAAPDHRLQVRMRGASTTCRCRRPLYEIFVYSPRVEGVHLRFGTVARGGLRWSDRPQDFRTEVLGLVKAQQVKNAVIVPVGAKGGFVPKQLAARRPTGRPGSRKAPRATASSSARCSSSPTTSTATASCRRRTPCGTTATIPISSSPPTRARRPSPTSPTRSSIEKGFWLGDAFASGGSQGYDHKTMGITARGAWEAVKRHFREMDVDIQTRARHGRRRRRHVGRRVRQRHAALARRSSSSPPSITATSSSIPTPIRPRPGPSASACSISRARAGRITTRR